MIEFIKKWSRGIKIDQLTDSKLTVKATTPTVFRFGESEAEQLKFVFTGNKQKIKVNKGYNTIDKIRLQIMT